ncbi:MAG: hypothetical protein QXQ46_11755 [Thermoplasmatales archaeon]
MSSRSRKKDLAFLRDVFALPLTGFSFYVARIVLPVTVIGRSRIERISTVFARVFLNLRFSTVNRSQESSIHRHISRKTLGGQMGFM